MSYGEFGIPKFEAGQRVPADDLSKVARQAARGDSGGDAYVDATGVYPVAGAGAAGLRWEWGKLNGFLDAGGTATMSVWQGDPLIDTGNDIPVSAPPLLATGQLAKDSWVWVQHHNNGLWYVMGAPC